jgi:pilus assembly protein Flp/PilA
MQARIGSVLRDDTGATAIEYGLIGGLIALVIITAVALVGADLQLLYEDTAAKIAAVL